MNLKREKRAGQKDQLTQQVRCFLSRNFSLKKRETLLIGLSGGCDSIALAHALKQIEKEKGFVCRALHLNHLLRGTESKRDEIFVRKFCEKNDLPLDVACEDVAEAARLAKKGIEETARKCRLHFFKKSAKTSLRLRRN